MSDHYNIHKLSDHLFRHEAGKMVAVLTKVFGTENLETSEDVVQQTFIDAIAVWKLKGIPENPSAWLFRVAKNKAIDIIRRNKHSVQYDFSDNERKLLTSEYTMAATMENMWKEELIKDDMLRMMFATCHPGISQENQITLILKTLCGFSVSEIAKAFLTSEETVTKRLYRSREFFRNNKVKLTIPSVSELKTRLTPVLNSIYLLFNEGYNSTGAEQLIRKDLMSEAMLLCKLITENQHTQLPEAYALMALMCFHSARSESRIDDDGSIILMKEQDRKKWNADLIHLGDQYLNNAAFGNEISAFHLEAAIAFEHCMAKNFVDTNWQRILELYELLGRIAPSPISELNKIVAIMQLSGPEVALIALNNIRGKDKLESYYLYHSLSGEIYFKLKNADKAKTFFEEAIKLTQSESEKRMLQNRIVALGL